MRAPDAYDILGVDPGASRAVIDRAFKRLARTGHPDAGGDEDTWKAVSDAYQTLRDPARRRRADSARSAEKVPVAGKFRYAPAAPPPPEADPTALSFAEVARGALFLWALAAAGALARSWGWPQAVFGTGAKRILAFGVRAGADRPHLSLGLALVSVATLPFLAVASLPWQARKRWRPFPPGEQAAVAVVIVVLGLAGEWLLAGPGLPAGVVVAGLYLLAVARRSPQPGVVRCRGGHVGSWWAAARRTVGLRLPR